MSAELFRAMAQSIVEGDADAAAALARQAVQAGIDPLKAIAFGYMGGVNEVGDQYACGNVFLPELVMAGEAMKAAVAALEPELKKNGASRERLGRVVLATVEGDIHEIGKSLVGAMLSAAGFEVHDLGVNAPAETIIARAEELGADIIGLSALLTTTMTRQQEVIEALNRKGLRNKFRVIVGGAPVTWVWAQRIKADGYGKDAVGAVQIAKTLMKEQHP